jgi:hypothetical protein
MCELVAGGGLLPSGIEVLQIAEVHREAADGGVGDAFHGRIGEFVKFFTKTG